MKAAIVALATLTLFTAAAHAEGEGSGDPFPFRAPPIATTRLPKVSDTGSMAYPDPAGRAGQVVVFQGSPIAPNGSEGAVQTAASLPRGFSDGTAATMQAEAVKRYFAMRAQRRMLVQHSNGHLSG